MKLSLLIVLVASFLNAFSQNKNPRELGIGFAIATNPFQFEDGSVPKNLYKDKGLSEPLTLEAVYPFFLKPDYGLYHFICLEKTSKYYRILVNDSETVYMSNDTNFFFQSWEMMLLNANVERASPNNPIRQTWKPNSEIIKYPCESDRLAVSDVIEVNGEHWIQVFFSNKCDDYPDNNDQITYGWIKWKSENKLLISLLLLC